MIIQGILDNSLNGQLCIRGFANIKELARLSEADYSYQRGLLDRSDISDFLETQTYLFFPEVILSYKFRYKFDEKKGEPLKLIQEGRSYKSNVRGDNTEISIKVVNPKDNNALPVKVAELKLDEGIEKPFHRIDGNHRLNAAEQSSSDKVGRMVIPFCLLLGTEYYDAKDCCINNDVSKNFDKAVKVFFHNINTKTIPLTSEENLKVMIDDTDNFPDEELEDIFAGRHSILTRRLINRVNPDIFIGISHILNNNYRTYFNDIFHRLLIAGIDEDAAVEKVSNSLQAVSQLYNDNANLKANDSFGLLTAFLWYHINGIDKYNAFKNWIFNNHIFEIKEVKASSIIRIFDKLISQEIKVFVAMPYFEGNAEIIEEYNKIYSDVITGIAEEKRFNISLFPIMCNKGATGDQIQDIINKIKEAKIVFADITDNNANVLYELGWARALEKKVVIVKRKNSKPTKSDIQNDTWHEYDDSCRSISLGRIAKDNIIEILKNNYGLVSD
ncbi:MAG: hypothetical protein IJP44_06405 [Bacteroidales bacterium]|nr:hypothetical protein [Bacteroidales bacterium]